LKTHIKLLLKEKLSRKQTVHIVVFRVYHHMGSEYESKHIII